MECAKASSKLAEALVIAEEKRQLLQRVALTQSGRSALSQLASNLKPASDAKKILPEVDKMAKAIISEVGPSAK
jgi:ATP-dependent Zn protease